jgi:histidinol dehydrogenase
MALMTMLNTNNDQFAGQWQQLQDALSLKEALRGNQDQLSAVRDIINTVQSGGDKALCELTSRFDQVNMTPQTIRISQDALAQSHKQMAPQLLTALRQSIENVRTYQTNILIKQPADVTTNGATLGVRYKPIKRVGVCIPGASAPLVSTVIMTIVPAQVAGVSEIAVISSPSYQGSIHPDILGTCYELGVKEVYRISGAQAVAALALGTETIIKVDKIVGPGNSWGQLAKVDLYGVIDIDSYAGPSDVLIIADDSVKPAWIAADLLSQAEHNPGSATLVTNSQTVADNVIGELETQIKQLSRGQITKSCLKKWSAIVVAKDIDQCIDLANDYAPEHLQILCRDCDAVADRIDNAGAIFVGEYTPVAVGDYYAGPSHTLPIGGSSRFFSGLTCNDFIKSTSLLKFDNGAINAAIAPVTTIANIEGLDAHARSLTIRSEQ